MRRVAPALFIVSLLLGLRCSASETDQSTFHETVKPFLQAYCVDCHSGDTTEGDLNLASYSNLDSVIADFRHWNVVLQRLQADDMPPEDAQSRPSDEQRESIIRWLQSVRASEAKRTSGDPGPVLAHRLSNTQYDNTIGDLTGVDLRPTAEFPIDPANEAGFDNSGESLTMSPALVKKYLDAARKVSSHLVLTPTGLDFSPHPVMTDTDRDKYCVNRIIDFYKRQRTDHADYIYAAWLYKHRTDLDRAADTLDDFANDVHLSPRYLATVSQTLDEPTSDIGPVAAIQTLWQELPRGVSADERDTARRHCELIDELLVALRERLVPDVKNLTAPQVHNGSQPLVLWKNQQFVANRMRYASDALPIDQLDLSSAIPDSLSDQKVLVEKLSVPEQPELAPEFASSLKRFCEVFPDAFFISERARVYLDKESEKKLAGRYLSAGFHSQMGYFRDDQPLYELMLDESQKAELDRLWLELDFVTSAPMRQYAGFIWFDRTDSAFMRDPEFDRFRAEDKDCTSETKVRELSDAYLAKAKRAGASDKALSAIRDYFESMSATFRRLEALHVESEPVHLQALLQFAERAYRRPLADHDREQLVAFYHELRSVDGLSHEDAIRDCVISVLMSPYFCYRVDLPSRNETRSSAKIEPLDDFSLANRLSYFLWSTMPDQELWDLAAAGKLHDPDVLVQQTRRMLQDDRVRGLAIDFMGNWLDFRRFEQHNGVERDRFPQFTNELRQAMFDEPLRLFIDIAQRDASVLDFLDAEYTFVNPVLAKHYGVPQAAVEPESWVRLDDAARVERGGLLPMAVFLTNNSPGLRTSPVKRGNWLVKRILGEHIPAPPPSVPELPSDEAKLGDLTLRETLQRHREEETCAACHDRIDAFGLVFEGYGPVGERRQVDLGGRDIDSEAEFPDGTSGQGLVGLKHYLKTSRQSDFVDNLSRQLLSYGLTRSVQLSDDDVLAKIRLNLPNEDFRFGGIVETIVTSPQFLNRRVE